MKKFIKPWQENNLWCGTTTIYAGSFAQGRSYKHIEKILPIASSNVIVAEQPHSVSCALVSKKDRGKTISKVDGLVTYTSGLLLGVRTADCIPIFFYDSALQVVGIAHAGWRGTLGLISVKMVNLFKKLGSKTKNIKIHLGPHIKAECYEVGKEIAEEFIHEFKVDNIIRKVNRKVFLDLSQIHKILLKSVGILEQNIDVSPYCTFCNNIFYSYRRDYKMDKGFDEMFSFIGLK